MLLKRIYQQKENETKHSSKNFSVKFVELNGISVTKSLVKTKCQLGIKKTFQIKKHNLFVHDDRENK